MVLFTSRPSTWLPTALLTSTLLAHLSTICLAQDSTSDTGTLAMANAKSPLPSSSITSRASSTSSAPAQTHTVQVGLADHKFNPEVTNANVGDTVEFRFYPTNHSVVRAEYGFPCIPYEMTGPNRQGFFSGFHSVDKVLDDAPKYSLQINNTSPLFFYCSAPGSCLTYGMVGTINPNSSTPISAQISKAKDSTFMLNPGEPFPAEAPLASNAPGSSSSGPAPAGSGSGSKHALSAAAIAGIVLGTLATTALSIALLICLRQRKSPSSSPPQLPPASPAPEASYLKYKLPQPHDTDPSHHHHHHHAFHTPHISPQNQYILPPPGHPAYSSPRVVGSAGQLHEMPDTVVVERGSLAVGKMEMEMERGDGGIGVVEMDASSAVEVMGGVVEREKA